MGIVELVHERGPMTVAAFMDLALYDPESGYYARAAKRSGRAGDFFTSVDVGPLFGELLEIQIAEMAALLESRIPNPESPAVFDLVEAGAGNAQLSSDILRASRRRDPDLHHRIRLHLVEASAPARAAGRAMLGENADVLASSSGSLPAAFTGVLLANELLDAFPVHQVVMRSDGLREVYVDVADSSRRRSVLDTREHHRASAWASGGGAPLVLIEDSPSTPALGEYLDRLHVTLEPGWRAEIGLRAIDWIREVAERLDRGFVVLIDYGHEARELYSDGHSQGTLTTFSRHMAGGPAQATRPSWLERPGEQDITAHVDFTSIRAAAEAAGLTTLGFLDQTYFLMALLEKRGAESVSEKDSRALKTLLLPGGLGSTHKVLILGKGVGNPRLCGCSSRMRVT